MIADLVKYIPAIIAAGVFLAVSIHGWFFGGGEPSKFLIGATVALALVPLASSLKVFDLIEFRKSVEKLDTELADTKQEIAAIQQNVAVMAASLSTSSNATQGQSLVNIVVDSFRAAQEATSQLTQGLGRSSESQNDRIYDSGNRALNPTFTRKLYLVLHLHGILSEIRLGLLVRYYVVETISTGKIPKVSDSFDMKLEDLIVFFQEKGNLGVAPSNPDKKDEEDIEYLKRLEGLNEAGDRLFDEMRVCYPQQTKCSLIPIQNPPRLILRS